MAEEDAEELALRLWGRLDRQHHGCISRDDLHCEDFHNLILAAVAPTTKGAGTGGASYGRARLNMSEAVAACQRKAALKSDGTLSFAEFRSLIRALRTERDHTSMAYLTFALFDLDQSLSIDKLEFREVMRFFLGRNATEVEFVAEWGRLASRGQAEKATRDDYIRWLRTTPSPAFHQHAPPQSSQGSRAEQSRTETSFRQNPRWNKRFSRAMNPGHVNDHRPQGLREYFSTSQSLPELKRFYQTYPDTFSKNLARLEDGCGEPEGDTPAHILARHKPGGTMLDHRTGEVRLWDDAWSPPLRTKARFNPSDKPFAPRALFGELTDVFAMSREGRGVKPLGRSKKRSTTKVQGGAPLGALAPHPDAKLIRPARPTTLSPEP